MKIMLSQVHGAALASQTIAEASKAIGVSETTLNLFLGNFTFEGRFLTFVTLKNIKLDEGIKEFNDLYTVPLEISPLDLVQEKPKRMGTATLMTRAEALALKTSGHTRFNVKKNPKDVVHNPDLHESKRKKVGSSLSMPDSSPLLLTPFLSPLKSEAVEYSNAPAEANADFNEPALSLYNQSANAAADFQFDANSFNPLDFAMPQDELAQGPNVGATLNICDAVLEECFSTAGSRTIPPLTFSDLTFFQRNAAVGEKQDVMNWTLPNL